MLLDEAKSWLMSFILFKRKCKESARLVSFKMEENSEEDVFIDDVMMCLTMENVVGK